MVTLLKLAMNENDWSKDVILSPAGTLADAAGPAVELPHAARAMASAPVDAITVNDRMFRTLHSLLRLAGFTAEPSSYCAVPESNLARTKWFGQ